MTLLECLNALSLPRLFLWVSIIVGIVYTIAAIYWLNKGENSFRLEDLFTEGTPPKASLNKLILLIFAALSVWITINAALDNRIDPSVVNLLLGVLGIFVIGRAANQAVAQFSARPQRQTVEIQQQNVNQLTDGETVEEQERRAEKSASERGR
jgi:hypothetical protein